MVHQDFHNLIVLSSVLLVKMCKLLSWLSEWVSLRVNQLLKKLTNHILTNLQDTLDILLTYWVALQSDKLSKNKLSKRKRYDHFLYAKPTMDYCFSLGIGNSRNKVTRSARFS